MSGKTRSPATWSSVYANGSEQSTTLHNPVRLTHLHRDSSGCDAILRRIGRRSSWNSARRRALRRGASSAEPLQSTLSHQIDLHTSALVLCHHLWSEVLTFCAAYSVLLETSASKTHHDSSFAAGKKGVWIDSV